MEIRKKYILIKFEVKDDVEWGTEMEVSLTQGRVSGYYDWKSYENSTYNKEFDSEEEAMEFMLKNQLYGEWICVPLFSKVY